MKLTRCEHGHYFDELQHSRCPSCGVSGLNVQAEVSLMSELVQDLPMTQVSGHNQQVSEIGATVAIVRKQTGMDPVVGWLVCIAGPDKGRDYRVRSERNSIGRAADMVICIAGDAAISRENHAFISFNPRKSSFRIGPGESRGMVYLNGEEVDVPMPLNAYDRIELGETTLLFIPLCGEQFSWLAAGE